MIFFQNPKCKIKKNRITGKKKFIGRDVNNHIDLERAKKDY